MTPPGTPRDAAVGLKVGDVAAPVVSGSRLGTAEASVGGNDTAVAGHTEASTGESIAGGVRSERPGVSSDADHVRQDGSFQHLDTQATTASSSTASSTVVAAPVRPAQQSWIRRHWRIPTAGLTVLVLTLLVVAGVVWIPRKGGGNNLSEQDLEPFYQAVANLAAAPSIGYTFSSSSPGRAPGQAEVRVLRDGTAVGNYERIVDYDVVTVGGKTYFKPRNVR